MPRNLRYAQVDCVSAFSLLEDGDHRDSCKRRILCDLVTQLEGAFRHIENDRLDGGTLRPVGDPRSGRIEIFFEDGEVTTLPEHLHQRAAAGGVVGQGKDRETISRRRRRCWLEHFVCVVQLRREVKGAAGAQLTVHPDSSTHQTNQL